MVGVYAADKITNIMENLTAIIAHTQMTTPDKEFAAIYIDAKGYGTYFDSYGFR